MKWELSPTLTASGLPSRRVMPADALASLVTGIFGALFTVVFWVAAAFLFDVSDVGYAGVMISAAVGVATLSNLGIGVLVSRILPFSGPHALRWFFRGNFAVFALSVLVGAALVAVAPRDIVFEYPWQMWTFPLLVGVLALFTVYDPTVSGLGRARWGAFATLVHAAARLILLPILALFSLGSTAIVLAWFLPVVLIVPVLSAAIIRRIGVSSFSSFAPHRISGKQVWSGVVRSHGPAAVGALPGTLLPVFVIAYLGPHSAGYFIVAFSIISMFMVTLNSALGPFVSAAEQSTWDLAGLTYRFTFLLSLLSLASVMFLAVIVPTALGLISHGYQQNNTMLIYAAAAAIPLLALQAMYGALSRIANKYGRVLLLQVGSTAVLLAGAAIFTSAHGLAAIGWSLLVSVAIVAVVIAVPIVRAFRAALATGSAD
ncbi:hypothetical protein GCM10011410_13550 [Hoyosella rhizosphaerae]|uniref:Polysaccharide biosynthesis protein n=2 Tax=Hoyosella rhizosphaerae TaxID=1755582 RepID=A0A916XBT8_9ACTN|nr:hypothetical protein GCM10011410_13550 [Hoyosella rhizosphaerae]